MSAASYTIQGRVVTLPVEVRKATNAAAMYAVPTAALQALVPGRAFDVVDVGGGQSQLILGLIDYEDNDLGDYAEVAVIAFVRPRGEPDAVPGSFILHLPVDQSFTCEAGCTIWGFPKSVEKIDYRYEGDGVRGRLEMDGKHVFTLSLPTGGAPGDTSVNPGVGYTYIEGVPHRTPMTTGGGAVINPPGRAPELELGNHPISDALRSLGLPAAPLLTTWTPHLRGTFGTPEKLEI
jgi:hypothetical protein